MMMTVGRAILMIFLTLVVFSHLYGYTYAEGFLSPFPTSPHNATQNPVNGSYDLIEWKNLSFIAKDIEKCMSVGQEMNEDPGFLFFQSTGVHGRSLKNGIIIAVILYLLPLSLFATIDSDVEGEAADVTRKRQVVHIFTFFTILLLSGLMIDLAIHQERDDRCGADGYKLSTLGATPGSHKHSTAWKTFGTVVPAVLIFFSGFALLFEMLAVADIGDVPGKDHLPKFKLILAYILPIMLFLQALYIGVIVGENASDLCDSPYTDDGAARLTIEFLFTMLTYVISPLASVTRMYVTGETKGSMGMQSMKMSSKMTTNQKELVTTFI